MIIKEFMNSTLNLLNGPPLPLPCMSQGQYQEPVLHSGKANSNYSVFVHSEFSQEKVVFVEIFFSLYCAASTCLLFIVITYAATWRKQTLNGWTVLAFSVSTFFSYLFWTIGLGKWLFQTERICDNVKGEIRPVLIGTSFCDVVGAAILFFDFAAFTWMTILDFHICETIRSMKPRTTASTNKKRFWIFCLFGFGVPTVITVVSLILEHQIGYFDDKIIRTEYGYDPCGIDKYYVTHMIKIVYVVFLVLKFTFSCLIIKALWNYRKGTKLVHHNTPNPRKEIVMYTKLVVLMDFTWVFEIIWGLNFDETNTYTWYKVVQDVIYIIQAFCLFWVFVCKREMRELISQEYSFCKRGFNWIDERFKWITCIIPSQGNENGTHSKGLSTGSMSAGPESTSKGIAPE